MTPACNRRRAGHRGTLGLKAWFSGGGKWAGLTSSLSLTAGSRGLRGGSLAHRATLGRSPLRVRRVPPEKW